MHEKEFVDIFEMQLKKYPQDIMRLINIILCTVHSLWKYLRLRYVLNCTIRGDSEIIVSHQLCIGQPAIESGKTFGKATL